MQKQQITVRRFDAGWQKAYSEHKGGALWSEEPIPLLSGALEVILARGHKTVVDAGCGDGRNLSLLAKAGLIVTGVDISRTALERTQRRLRKVGAEAFLVEANVANMPFATHSVDCVVCLDTFGQLNDPSRFVEEMKRVVVPTGLVVLNAPTPGDSQFGVGQPIGDNRFVYEHTLFAYYEEYDVRTLFAGWHVELTKERWPDPPHGNFRPYAHWHESWVVMAQPFRHHEV